MHIYTKTLKNMIKTVSQNIDIANAGDLPWSHSSWRRHQMETFSALLDYCVGNSPVTGEFPSQRPVTRSFDVSLICAWINGWVKIGEAGDLRRHHAHYDVTVMMKVLSPDRCQSILELVLDQSRFEHFQTNFSDI